MNTRTTSHRQPSTTAPAQTTVAGYLLTRLAEAGVVSVFGVPGDDNLDLLDAIAARPSLAWIATATEQGAGYAADSYARLRGLGAVVTTFGASELSALNAIAGAYAESVPVVHIVGTPALAAKKPGVTFPRALPGAGFDHFATMAAGVTAAQADLRPDTAPAEIDRVLSTALRSSRPVYLTVPADVAGAPVPSPVGRAAPVRLRRAARHRAVRRRGPGRGRPAGRPDPPAAPGEPLTQRSLWTSVQEFLLPGDLIVADRDTAFCGAAGLRLPVGAQLIGQPVWAAAGWTLPAALGACLAEPDRRLILITGDGAMRHTAPELGTLLGQGVAPVILVLDHDGYPAERIIHERSAEHCDIPAWDWTALPAAVAPAVSTVAVRASHADELTWALSAANYHTDAGRPVLIEAALGAEDAPPPRRDLSLALARR